MQKISSRDNQKLKRVRKIRDGRIKNEIFIEGQRLAKEALRSNIKLSDIFISESFFQKNQDATLTKLFQQLTSQTYLVPDKIFNTLTSTKSSQGIVLTASLSSNGQSRIEKLLEKRSTVFSRILLLHQINNPSNLGAIMRTAEAAGVLGIITTKGSANAFSPKTLRGSMGAGFRLPIWENAEFDEALDWAKKMKLLTISADINARTTYLEIDWRFDYLLVFGSEAHGLNKAERAQINHSFFIPMDNEVESLNLAVACGIVLFEAKKLQ